MHWYSYLAICILGLAIESGFLPHLMCSYAAKLAKAAKTAVAGALPPHPYRSPPSEVTASVPTRLEKMDDFCQEWWDYCRPNLQKNWRTILFMFCVLAAPAYFKDIEDFFKP